MSLPQPLLTLFAAPKPFADVTTRGPQHFAIESWLRLPDCEVILVGDDRGVADVAASYGIRHVGDVTRNEHGTPLVRGVFEAAERIARAPLLCYVNADILLFPDLIEAVRAVQLDRFLMVGRRWDLDPRYIPDPREPEWERKVRAAVRRHGYLQLPDAIDYFVFTRGLWQDMPPLALGRTVWDNWLLYRARESGAPLIDAARAVTPVHQNHDYSHHPNGTKGVWFGPEARRNVEIAGGPGRLLFISDADCMLDGDVVRPAPGLRRAGQVLFSGPRLHPRGLLPYRLASAIDLRRRALWSE